MYLKKTVKHSQVFVSYGDGVDEIATYKSRRVDGTKEEVIIRHLIVAYCM